MFKNEKKILTLSILISIIFHLLLFGIFYFVNIKNQQQEKEKIITLSLETLKEKEAKPSIQSSPIETKEEEPKKTPVTKPEPKPKLTQQEKPKIEKPKPIEPKPKQEVAEKPIEQPKQEINSKPTQPTDTNTSQQPPTEKQPKVEESKPIDITKGKPDTFKQPEKKEEDINGYLKELIRYLNQQARERDLYPPLAKRLKIEGEVIVRVTINEDGTIDENSIKIVDPSGYNVLDRGAIEILKKLQPYKKPPKKITVEIPIVFQILYM